MCAETYENRRENFESASMMPTSLHKPVMLQEVLSLFGLKEGMVVVDGTIGLGGHAVSFIEKIAPRGKLVAIDKDEESLAMAASHLKRFLKNCFFVHDDFRNVDKILDRLGIDGIDAFFLDLGISSYQLDTPARGFSLRSEGPLDMRMDRKSFISAYDLLNNLTEDEIASILWKFGQERFSRRIARRIIQARSRASISSTKELADLVTRAMPYKARFSRIHPATRTFQSLRIAVNRELDSLDEALKKAALYMNKKGRLGVISFHSLEDRIVKENFRRLVQTGRFRYVFKKILVPTQEEIRDNPRARSAKMRMIERVK